MKTPDERWRLPDKQKAYAILRFRPVIILIAVTVLAILSHLVPYFYGKWQRGEREMAIIMSIIEEANPSYDPVFAKATAKFMIRNSANFDPVLIACIWRWESAFLSDNESHIGASGFGGNLPTKKERNEYSKGDWLSLELQSIQTVDDLNLKYECGYCTKINKKGICLKSKGAHTIYGMHRGYVGGVKNVDIVNNYITKIYTLYESKRGHIWR
jgi:hypothetical protein